MSLILSGTDGLSDVDGTAATPAIRGTDANTGIFFPAADTVAFAEGGVEAMRIDSAGNVGIGTSSPNNRISLKTTGGGCWMQTEDSVNTSGANVNLFGSFGSGAAAIYTSGANPITFTTNNTERMRIDSSGNVGIGTSSPQSLLDLTGNDPTLRLTDNAGSPASTFSIRSTDGTLKFRDVTNSLDRVTIDSSGNLQFNSGYGSVATAYGCRAWVNFNGTGTVAIRGSGNVSSITDIATGTYTVNLTTAMPDANYAIQISTGFASGVREDVLGVLYNDAPYTPTTTAYTIKFYRADTNVAVDSNYSMTSIFR